jgi:hypothetical protein
MDVACPLLCEMLPRRDAQELELLRDMAKQDNVLGARLEKAAKEKASIDALKVCVCGGGVGHVLGGCCGGEGRECCVILVAGRGEVGFVWCGGV